jgi:hypothetical protein
MNSLPFGHSDLRPKRHSTAAGRFGANRERVGAQSHADLCAAALGRWICRVSEAPSPLSRR